MARRQTRRSSNLRQPARFGFFRRRFSGAVTDRAQLHRAIKSLGPGDVLLVTRLDRLARSTRDLLNTIAAISDIGAGFKSVRDTWADTTTAHGRLMLTHPVGLGGVRARTDPEPHQRGANAQKRAAFGWAGGQSSPPIRAEKR
jgi:hypothetical protein